MTMGRSSSSRCSSSRSRSSGSGPIRCTRTGRARQARMAPRISGSGALSVPTASSAMSVSIGVDVNLLGFLHFQHGAAFVRSALGAGAMGQLLLVAVRALGEPGCGEKVVGTADGGTARGVAPFRIRHDAVPFEFCPLKLLAGAGTVERLVSLARLRKRGRALLQTTESSGLDPAAQPGQRLPAGVDWTLIAGAGLGVAIGSAARAKSLAVGLAQRPDRQGQKHLLAQHIFKQQTVFLIITDFGLGRCNGPLGRRRNRRRWGGR